jgi:hypothetical protein
MWTFYLLSLIPIIVGAVLWALDKEVVWQEWLASALVALVMSCIFHYAAIQGMTGDIETWSGQVTYAHHHTEWVEEWIETHSESYDCGTRENPQTCTRYWTTIEHDTHREHWTVDVSLGSVSEEWEVSYVLYADVMKKFGGRVYISGLQRFHHGGTFDGGDQNLYTTANETRYIYPITRTFDFQNKIKAAPSVFSFAKVPTNVVVFSWPQTTDNFKSGRVLGTAQGYISNLEWDQLNAVLGPQKQVNLIIAGFGSDDMQIAHYQQAAWIGGKKNDLVITFGGDPKKPSWVYTFGWTESELCKRNIDTYLLHNGITTNFLPYLKGEVTANYKIKDWKKFDYIRIEPRASYYYWFIGLMIVFQGGLWIFAHMNQFRKDSYGYRTPWSSRGRY